MNTRRSSSAMVVLLSLAALSACSGSVDSGTGGTSSSSGGTGGSSACDDLAAKYQGCCDKLTGANKTSCEESLKAVKEEGDPEACEVALDELGTTCD